MFCRATVRKTLRRCLLLARGMIHFQSSYLFVEVILVQRHCLVSAVPEDPIRVVDQLIQLLPKLRLEGDHLWVQRGAASLEVTLAESGNK